jgi:hypothetical protein
VFVSLDTNSTNGVCVCVCVCVMPMTDLVILISYIAPGGDPAQPPFHLDLPPNLLSRPLQRPLRSLRSTVYDVDEGTVSWCCRVSAHQDCQHSAPAHSSQLSALSSCSQHSALSSQHSALSFQLSALSSQLSAPAHSTQGRS